MPTLFRFVTVLAVLAGAVFAVMLALIFLVEPQRRSIVIDVPLKLRETGAGRPAAGATAP